MEYQELAFETTSDGCIICISIARQQSGYYLYNRDGHTKLHRYLYSQKYGEIPPFHVLTHSCHNLYCVNLDHIKCVHRDEVRHRFHLFDGLEYSVNENGCWICTSNKPDHSGYPLISRSGWRGSAHRYIYMQLYGWLPSEILVRHLCNNRMCINPDHLECGSVKDNAADKVRSGRCNPSLGERSPTHKLTDCDVLKIRNSDKSIYYWANLLGLSPVNVWRAKVGKTWRHIKET